MIRIRSLIPWLAIILVAVASRSVLRNRVEQQPNLKLERRPTFYQEDMYRQQATSITGDGWTEFQLAPGSERIRVLSNAVISRMAASRESEINRPLESPRRGWRYSLDYELLDVGKRPISRSTYHFRGRTEQWQDPETGEFRYPIELDGPGLAATQTRVMQFSTIATPPHPPTARQHSPHEPPAYLRVRLGDRDAAVESVLVRVYDLIARPEYDESKTWTRMSLHQRERLCRSTVFDSELLTIDEREDLLRRMWVPAMSLNNFETATMYLIDRSRTAASVAPDTSAKNGTLIDANCWVSYAVPKRPGVVTLQARPAPPIRSALRLSPAHREASGSESCSIELDYQSDVPELGSSTELRMAQDLGHEMKTFGGLLILKPNAAATAQVRWRSLRDSQTQDIELEPADVESRFFLVDQQALQYDVHSVEEANTPLRIVARIPLDPAFARNGHSGSDSELPSKPHSKRSRETKPPLTCELLDRQGNIAKSFTIGCSLLESPLDRMEVLGSPMLVSKPTIRYLTIPETVSCIRFSTAGTRVLVSVSNRPPDLHQSFRIERESTSVPDSPEATAPRSALTLPAWFAIRPRNDDEWIAQNRSYMIRSHRRPVDRDADIVAGRSQWYRFEPTGTWFGKEAMICRTQLKGLKEIGCDESSPNSNGRVALSQFWKLAPGETYQFQAYDNDHVRTAAAEKLVAMSDGPVGRVVIEVNGETWSTDNLVSRRGEVELPHKLPDRGTIRIESDSRVMLFLRGCVVKDAPAFLRRTLQAFGTDDWSFQIPGAAKTTDTHRAGELVYDYKKLSDSDELISIKYFHPQRLNDSATAPIKIRISLRERGRSAEALDANPTDGLLKAWTIRSREYVIAPQGESDSIVLDSGERLLEAAKCFFRLGGDLARGEYQIVIEPVENASAGYVLVSQTLAGEAPQRLLHVDGSTDD